MKKKQTAVEWLKDQIECFGNKHELQMSWATLDELLEQAKQIEKEQIEKSYTSGREQWQKYEWDNSNHENDVEVPTPRKYYNNTYGNHISDVSKMVGGQDEQR